jgi:hypothetical protein
MLRRLLRVAILASLVMVAAPTTHVLACSCAQMTREQALSNADVAFVGVVAAIDDPAEGPLVNSGELLRYTFAVESELKAELASTIGLFSARSGASCGQEFGLAQRWRVFAYVDETGRLQSSLCSGNELLAEGVPIPPQAPTSLMPPMTVLVAVGVVLALGAISAWAFLRRPGEVS